MKLTWRSELVHVFTAAMEAAWLSPVLLVIGYSIGYPRLPLVGLPLWLLLYFSRLLARWITGAGMDLGRSRLLLVYMAAASMLLALKGQNYPAFSWLSADWLRQAAIDITTLSPALGAAMLTAGTVIYAWWRAAQVVHQSSHPSYLFRQFQLGLLAVMVSTFLASRAGVGADFLPWLFWFFFWGLLAVAVSRLDDIARNRRATIEAYWLPILVAVAAVVVAAGGILAILYSHQVMDALRLLLQPVSRALDILVYIIAIPIGYLLQFLLELLQPLLAPLLQKLLGRLPELQQPANPLDELLKQQREPAHLPGPLQEALKWILIILILYIAFRLLARALRRRVIEDADDVEEVHESVWAPAELWAALRALWLRLLERLGLGPKKPVSAPPAPVTEEERVAYSIRQIYQRLLELAAGLGYPRPPGRTPYEFQTDLARALPASGADLSAITDAYVHARYGLPAVERVDVQAVQQAWQRVRAQGEEVRAAQQREARARRARWAGRG